MNRVGKELEGLPIQCRLLSPCIPVPIHLMRKADHNSADTLRLLLTAKIGEIVALRSSDCGKTTEGLNRKHGNSTVVAHFIEKRHQALSRRRYERKSVKA